MDYTVIDSSYLLS